MRHWTETLVADGGNETGYVAEVPGLRKTVWMEKIDMVPWFAPTSNCKEEDVPPRQSKRFEIRIVEPILDAMGITHDLLETEADVAKIQPALERAYQNSSPLVLLIGRSPLTS